MNEIKYFPKSTNSRYSYLKVFGIVIIMLQIFHVFGFVKKHNHSRWKIEVAIGLIVMIYLSFESITTKVIFNFEKKQLEVFYVTLFKNYKIEIPFNKLSIEFNKRRHSLSSYYVASHIYEDQKI